MSRKHNTKHRRGPSAYPERLAARGETNASVRQAFYDAHGKKKMGTVGLIRPAVK